MIEGISIRLCEKMDLLVVLKNKSFNECKNGFRYCRIEMINQQVSGGVHEMNKPPKGM
jgi:hypothetical protein